MKPWRSVSTRLTLTLLAMTLSSLVGLSVSLDIALRRFFINDAQKRLHQQANALAKQALFQWNNPNLIRQLVNMTSQETNVQVVVFDTESMARATSQLPNYNHRVELPTELIFRALAGTIETGVFKVASDRTYPQWLYSTVPIQASNNSQIIGIVYVAMPFKRSKQFAARVKGLVMIIALTATTAATVAGILLSRTLTQPLKVLYQQAQQLKAGDYSTRFDLKGQDELAQLSQLLDQMAVKLAETLKALQAQETARREWVANVSHDLRTPLTALRIELEAVIDGVVVGEKAQQYLQQACQETDYLSCLVDQLFLLAKADAGKIQVHPQKVSILAIAQECLCRMQPYAIKAGIELELRIDSPTAMVWVDPELTGQAFLNILDNAIKYSISSKVVYLSILPSLEKEQRQFIPCQIKDRGKGMSKDMVQRATERFYRGNHSRPKGGIGLGLSIAKRMCQLQGGNIQIESESEQGTIVTLLLPVTATTV